MTIRYRHGARLGLALILFALSTPLSCRPPDSPQGHVISSRALHVPIAGGSIGVRPLRALIVGGGPDRRDNQVAIESNVRYVNSLLPVGARRTILYAAGPRAGRIVLYTDRHGRDRYRRPTLAHIDGSSTLQSVRRALAQVGQSGDTPTLLYFTGHGSEGRAARFTDNAYDCWRDDPLTARDLSRLLATFPPKKPIVLVMAQCYSGAFGQVIFRDADPRGRWNDHDLCGFFASIPSREAAGCTSAVDEREYRDFTSFFFAALTGRARTGSKTTGADYNHDGHVGMDEAFCYALIHDDSIDTPVSTTDVFLRAAMQTPDDTIMATPYQSVLVWASAAQRAAIDALSRRLELTGEDRLAREHVRLRDNPALYSEPDDERADARLALSIRFLRVCKSVVLAHELMQTGSPEVQARFQRLREREMENPLVPFTDSPPNMPVVQENARNAGKRANTTKTRRQWCLKTLHSKRNLWYKRRGSR